MAPITKEPAASPPSASHPHFRVLLTGFGPFHSVLVNPSYECIKPLSKYVITTAPPPLSLPSTPYTSIPNLTSLNDRSIEITIRLIPVTYSSVLSLVPPLHNPELEEDQYDLIIHVGVGQGLKLECLARRYGYDSLDADGLACQEEKLPDGSSRRGFVGSEWDDVGQEESRERRTTISQDRVLEWCKEMGVHWIEESQDAGLFLCEYIYYCSLTCSAQRRALGKVGVPVQFIHIPPVNSPYSLEQLTEIIKLIVWGIVNKGGLST